MIAHFIGGPLNRQTRVIECGRKLYEHLEPTKKKGKLKSNKFLYNKTKLKIGLAIVYLLTNLSTEGIQINTAKITKDALTLATLRRAYDNKVSGRPIKRAE